MTRANPTMEYRLDPRNSSETETESPPPPYCVSVERDHEYASVILEEQEIQSFVHKLVKKINKIQSGINDCLWYVWYIFVLLIVDIVIHIYILIITQIN